MSFLCPKCRKALKTQAYLDRHLENKTCDYKCSECGTVCRNKPHFDRHIKAHRAQRIIETKVPAKPQTIDLVPLEDFNAKALKDYMRSFATDIKQTRVQTQLFNGNADDGTQVAEVDAVITTYHLSANALREMIPEELLISVLKSFEIDTSTWRVPVEPKRRAPTAMQVKLQRQMELQHRMLPHLHPAPAPLDIAAIPQNTDNVSVATAQMAELLLSLLSGVHASGNKRLHSICMGDTARKSVNFYSRAAVGDKAYWQNNNKDQSIVKLQGHVKQLYQFIIEAVVGTLKSYFVTSTKETIFGFATSEYVYAVSAEYLTGAKPEPTNIIDFGEEDESDSRVAAMMRINDRHYNRVEEETEPLPRLQKKREMGEGIRVAVTRLRLEEVSECIKGEQTEEHRALAEIINIKKAQLLQKLESTKLDSKSCMTFFNDSYPICIGTLKSTR